MIQTLYETFFFQLSVSLCILYCIIIIIIVIMIILTMNDSCIIICVTEIKGMLIFLNFTITVKIPAHGLAQLLSIRVQTIRMTDIT